MQSSEPSIKQRLSVLERQMLSVRRQNKEVDSYIDTVTSPLWKRAIWWFEGFYFRKVGRWYWPGWTPKWPR